MNQDLLRLILLRSSIKNLYSLIECHSTLLNIADDEYFWQQKINIDNPKLTRYIDADAIASKDLYYYFINDHDLVQTFRYISEISNYKGHYNNKGEQIFRQIKNVKSSCADDIYYIYLYLLGYNPKILEFMDFNGVMFPIRLLTYNNHPIRYYKLIYNNIMRFRNSELNMQYPLRNINQEIILSFNVDICDDEKFELLTFKIEHGLFIDGEEGYIRYLRYINKDYQKRYWQFLHKHCSAQALNQSYDELFAYFLKNTFDHNIIYDIYRAIKARNQSKYIKADQGLIFSEYDIKIPTHQDEDNEYEQIKKYFYFVIKELKVKFTPIYITFLKEQYIYALHFIERF